MNTPDVLPHQAFFLSETLLPGPDLWNSSGLLRFARHSQVCLSDRGGDRLRRSPLARSLCPMWCQHEVSLPAFHRGCHLVTQHVLHGCPEIQQVRLGLLNVFICHTSASLTINENADSDVLVDMGTALDRIVPERWPWTHTCEGPDDMPAHVKASMTDSSVNIPIRDGRLLTGTWQGIYLCEHRDHGGSRRLILTLQGEPNLDMQ